jgi:hypothetical protein
MTEYRQEELTESLAKYDTASIDLIKLETIERSSEIEPEMVSGLIIAFVGVLFVFFLSLMAGFYLSARMGDNYSGFAMVAGFYFLVGLILMAGKKKLVEQPLQKKIVRKIFSEN